MLCGELPPVGLFTRDRFYVLKIKEDIWVEVLCVCVCVSISREGSWRPPGVGLLDVTPLRLASSCVLFQFPFLQINVRLHVTEVPLFSRR